MESCVVTGHLVATIRGRVEFRSIDYVLMLKDGWAEFWCQNSLNSMQVLAEVTGYSYN